MIFLTLLLGNWDSFKAELKICLNYPLKNQTKLHTGFDLIVWFNLDAMGNDKIIALSIHKKNIKVHSGCISKNCCNSRNIKCLKT